MEESKNYYAMLGSERVGPMTLAEIRNLGIHPDTPVWKTGLPEWVNASTLPELAVVFNDIPVYPQHAVGSQPPVQGVNTPGYDNQHGYNGMPPRPDNYLVWCIVVTVLCCIVGGIVALVYSSKVNTLYDQGDYQGAVTAANNAKTWCIVSAILGFLFSIGYGGFALIGALANL